jgi:hypothetical protein
MLKKWSLAAAFAACSAAVLTAQTPSTSSQSQQPTPRTETRAASPSTTLTGIVYREQDVPGRAPNVAERAGILEDYILAEVTASKSASPSTPGATAPRARPPDSMYKLEMVPDEKLKAKVGKRVEVTGRIDAEAGDTKGQPPPGRRKPTRRLAAISSTSRNSK